MMRVSIVFDEEDYITPSQEGLDDLLKMLAEVMTQERISGTFFIIGERFRCLRDRGRKDVLAAVARHDVGGHINLGSIHPTVTERMEQAGWADGCARMAAEELAGLEEMDAILGKPMTSLARHGGSFCPQLLAMMSQRKLPYVYSPAHLPKHHVTWYCNTLNFYDASSAFQEAYLSRAAFLEAEKRFFNIVTQYKDFDWCAVFHSHPCMIKTKWFWDSNYFKGRNPALAECRVPDFRAGFNLEEVRSNWEFHCARLRDNPDLRLGTISDFASEFGTQTESITPREIMELAAQAAETETPFWTDRFTAAEILDFFARSYLLRSQARPLDTLMRRPVLGPTRLPLSVPSVRWIESEALRRVALGIVTSVTMTGMLPARICCGAGTLGSSGEIGIGSALAALGQVLVKDKPSQSVETRPVAPYPNEGEERAAEVRAFKSWPCHRLDLDIDRVARLAALQSWTLKPAWPQ